MESPVPDWLCNDFFTQCLQKEKNQNVIVTNVFTSPAAPPGSNYGSYITRVRIDYKATGSSNDDQVSSTSVVVKAELTHGAIRELFTDFEAYEHLFYKSFIPKAKELAPMTFIPKTLFSPRVNVLVLEDLKERGFLMADRLQKLDMNHCRLYVTTAATLHATSFAVFKQNPDIAEPFKKHKMFSSEMKGHELYLSMIKYGMKYFSDAAEKTENFQQYSDLLRDATPHLWEMLVEANQPSKDLNTLVQGDPWTTNMMFKYDENGAVSEMKLLDFQNMHWASPVHDLISFIWGCANSGVKKDRKFDQLYQLYFSKFNEEMERLKCTERLTQEQFLFDLKRYSPVILFQAACAFPVSIDPNPIDFGIFLPRDDGDESAVDNFYGKYYDDNFYKNILPESLECLELTGVFEFLRCYKK